MPAHPGDIRPSGEILVISAIISPVPPTARLPRWTKCQSLTVPSIAEYWHIGDITSRFVNVRSRSVNGENIGLLVIAGFLLEYTFQYQFKDV